MARRNEDFDEYSDPSNPRTIVYDNVVSATQRIRPLVEKTPCFISHLYTQFGINLFYKLESTLRTGSFKERGAINALLQLARDKKKIGVVIATGGNAGLSFCYYANHFSIPVTAVMPITVPIGKIQKCLSLGAKVVVQGSNLTETQRAARALARDKGLTYINSRDHPDILDGFGSVALEIMEQVPYADAIIVPVGSGGLIASVAAVIKHVKPSCLIYGVQTEVMPSFFKSLEQNEPITIPWVPTLADGCAYPIVGVNSFFNAKNLIDKMVLVNEDWIARAILHLIEKERFVIEGAGATPLAAVLGNLLPELKQKNVVCILTGGNIDASLLGRSIERGLAAEGRLVKFKVGIKNNSAAYSQLLNLLAAGGYNLRRSFHDRVWVVDDVYSVEIKMVIETKGLEHALELKRIIEKAYPDTAVFETEPFNDKRTCPCFVRKSPQIY